MRGVGDTGRLRIGGAALLLLLALLTGCDGRKTYISGKVTDGTRRVRDAQIYITTAARDGTFPGREQEMTTTNLIGTFEFTFYRRFRAWDRYYLVVRKEGCEPLFQNVNELRVIDKANFWPGLFNIRILNVFCLQPEKATETE